MPYAGLASARAANELRKIRNDINNKRVPTAIEHALREATYISISQKGGNDNNGA